MRLSDEQRTIITEEARRHFGAGAGVLLFGSRVHDDLRGGDIDLYIEADGSAEELLARELRFYATLQRRLGEQRIDIVVHRRDVALRDIDREARRTAVPL